MMTKEVLERYLRKELTLDDVRFQMIIKSHLEALAEIEVYKKESVLKNGLINQYKAEIEKKDKELVQLRSGIIQELLTKFIASEVRELKAGVESKDLLIDRLQCHLLPCSEDCGTCKGIKQALADGKKEE